MSTDEKKYNISPQKQNVHKYVSTHKSLYNVVLLNEQTIYVGKNAHFDKKIG